MKELFWHLVQGLFLILMLASGVGYVLQKRFGEANATIRNLNDRVRAWWGLVTLVLTAIYLGHGASIALFAVASYLALREFISLTPTRPGDHNALFLAFFIAIPVQYVSVWRDWYGFFSIFIPVYMFLLLSAAAALGNDTHEFLERNAKIQFAVMVCVYGLSYAPALLMLKVPGYSGMNSLLLFYLLFVVQLSDVLQYICGKLFGKHQLSAVSPSKTVEGLLGGGTLATLCGGALHFITPFSFGQACLLSAAIVLSGFLGGLVLSAVKRSLGAKDWGSIIAGHGGVLDRVDSICFAAPIFFHLTRFFFHG